MKADYRTGEFRDTLIVQRARGRDHRDAGGEARERGGRRRGFVHHVCTVEFSFGRSGGRWGFCLRMPRTVLYSLRRMGSRTRRRAARESGGLLTEEKFGR